jgi:hypothetical protein
MSLKRPAVSKFLYNSPNCCISESFNSTPQSDKTSASFKSTQKNSLCFSSEYIQNSLISECLKTESLLIETKNLAQQVEGLQRSFEKVRKTPSRRYSIDFYMNEESFQSEETIDVLRDQVFLAKHLETDDQFHQPGVNFDSFDNSFDSFNESFQLFSEDFKKDFKITALIRSIVLLKFNSG